MEYSTLVWLLSINIMSHIFIFIVNKLKIDRTYPVLFKFYNYSFILTLNILIFAIYAFSENLLKSSTILVYSLITGILFVIHFIFDEDWIFRFEKEITLITMTFLNVLFYITYYLILT